MLFKCFRLLGIIKNEKNETEMIQSIQSLNNLKGQLTILCKNLLSGLIEFKEMLTIEFVESRNLEISVKFTFA
jgi:hypothetical protein